ncbi:hypothetical protein EHM76_01375 [bacterium]|nr:MAG: hypothetical protein EHM76_01375 [bacterium]
MNNEITAFHPGEKYGKPVSGGQMTSPPNSAGSANVGPYQTGLDGWNEAKYRLPDTKRYVTCWNGHKMCKCLYDVDQDKWFDWQGKESKVYMWTSWQ